MPVVGAVPAAAHPAAGLSLPQLKDKLRALGLFTSGTKADLLARYEAAITGGASVVGGIEVSAEALAAPAPPAPAHGRRSRSASVPAGAARAADGAPRAPQEGAAPAPQRRSRGRGPSVGPAAPAAAPAVPPVVVAPLDVLEEVQKRFRERLLELGGSLRAIAPPTPPKPPPEKEKAPDTPAEIRGGGDAPGTPAGVIPATPVGLGQAPATPADIGRGWRGGAAPATPAELGQRGLTPNAFGKGAPGTPADLMRTGWGKGAPATPAEIGRFAAPGSPPMGKGTPGSAPSTPADLGAYGAWDATPKKPTAPDAGGAGAAAAAVGSQASAAGDADAEFEDMLLETLETAQARWKDSDEEQAVQPSPARSVKRKQPEEGEIVDADKEAVQPSPAKSRRGEPAEEAAGGEMAVDEPAGKEADEAPKVRSEGEEAAAAEGGEAEGEDLWTRLLAQAQAEVAKESEWGQDKEKDGEKAAWDKGEFQENKADESKEWHAEAEAGDENDKQWKSSAWDMEEEEKKQEELHWRPWLPDAQWPQLWEPNSLEAMCATHLIQKIRGRTETPVERYTKVRVKGLKEGLERANGEYLQQGLHEFRPYYENDHGFILYCWSRRSWCLSKRLGAPEDEAWAVLPKPEVREGAARPEVSQVPPATGWKFNPGKNGSGEMKVSVPVDAEEPFPGKEAGETLARLAKAQEVEQRMLLAALLWVEANVMEVKDCPHGINEGIVELISKHNQALRNVCGRVPKAALRTKANCTIPEPELRKKAEQTIQTIATKLYDQLDGEENYGDLDDFQDGVKQALGDLPYTVQILALVHVFEFAHIKASPFRDEDALWAAFAKQRVPERAIETVCRLPLEGAIALAEATLAHRLGEEEAKVLREAKTSALNRLLREWKMTATEEQLTHLHMFNLQVQLKILLSMERDIEKYWAKAVAPLRKEEQPEKLRGFVEFEKLVMQYIGEGAGTNKSALEKESSADLSAFQLARARKSIADVLRRLKSRYGWTPNDVTNVKLAQSSWMARLSALLQLANTEACIDADLRLRVLLVQESSRKHGMEVLDRFKQWFSLTDGKEATKSKPKVIDKRKAEQVERLYREYQTEAGKRRGQFGYEPMTPSGLGFGAYGQPMTPRVAFQPPPSGTGTPFRPFAAGTPAGPPPSYASATPGGFPPSSAAGTPAGFPPMYAAGTPAGFPPGSAAGTPAGFPPTYAAGTPAGFPPSYAAGTPAGFPPAYGGTGTPAGAPPATPFPQFGSRTPAGFPPGTPGAPPPSSPGMLPNSPGFRFLPGTPGGPPGIPASPSGLPSARTPAGPPPATPGMFMPLSPGRTPHGMPPPSPSGMSSHPGTPAGMPPPTPFRSVVPFTPTVGGRVPTTPRGDITTVPMTPRAGAAAGLVPQTPGRIVPMTPAAGAVPTTPGAGTAVPTTPRGPVGASAGAVPSTPRAHVPPTPGSLVPMTPANPSRLVPMTPGINAPRGLASFTPYAGVTPATPGAVVPRTPQASSAPQTPGVAPAGGVVPSTPRGSGAVAGAPGTPRFTAPTTPGGASAMPFTPGGPAPATPGTYAVPFTPAGPSPGTPGATAPGAASANVVPSTPRAGVVPKQEV